MFNLLSYIFIWIMVACDVVSVINLIIYIKANKRRKILLKNKSINKFNTCQSMCFSLAFFLFLVMVNHNPYPFIINIYVLFHIIGIFIYIVYIFVFDIVITNIKYNNEVSKETGILKRPTSKRKERLQEIERKREMEEWEYKMFTKIGITGDIHGDLNLVRIKKSIKMGYDCLIVAGDFGYLWDNSPEEIRALNEIEKLPITILFIDGNHENYKLLNKYPVSYWKNSPVQFIRKNVIHLLRGEVYRINKKKFFTFGGANSVDKEYLIENQSWWKEEMPTLEEMENGLYSLEINNNKVDYIITHTCSSELLPKIVKSPMEDELTDYLSQIKENTDYTKWFFGHMHINYLVTEKDMCLYKKIITIE